MHKITKIMILSLIAVLLVNTAEIPAQAASKTNWKELYAEHLATIENLEESYPTGGLIYVNNDNIPELYLQGNYFAIGNLLLTIYNNKVYEYGFDFGFSYLKKGNRLHMSGGKEGAYYDYVAKLSKGKMVGIAGGANGFDVFRDGNVKLDKDGHLIYQYYWTSKSKKGTDLDNYYSDAKNGRKVTEKAYKKKLNQALGKNRKKYGFESSEKTIWQIKKTLKMDSSKTDIDMVLKYYKAGQWKQAEAYMKKLPPKASRTCIKRLSAKEKKAYKATVQKYQKKYEKISGGNWEWYLHGYYLADIDGDKKTELLIHHGMTPLESVLTVFKYKNGKAKKVAETYSSSNTSYYAYPGHKGILFRYGANAYEEIGSLSLKKGKLEKRTYNGRTIGAGGYEGWFPLRQALDNHIRTKKTGEYSISWNDLKN